MQLNMRTALERRIRQLLLATVTASACGLVGAPPLVAQNADSLALVALYSATSGQGWTNSAGWLSSPLDSWHGVTLDSGRVTGLALHSNGLRRARGPHETGDGTLPPEIGNLDALRSLDLSGNEIRGALPATVANLEALQSLQLQNNLLTDLPDLSALAGLVSVDVRWNFLTFEDLEPNVGKHFTLAYAPQHLVEARRTVMGLLGETVTLHVPVGGANNQYQWYKDGTTVPFANSDSLVIAQMAISDAGTYQLHVTNTLVTDLVLLSTPTTVRFDQRFASLWLDIGAYHHAYAASGAHHESSPDPAGMQYPAILRYSGHLRAKAWWVGAKNWSNSAGVVHPYYVVRVGPRASGAGMVFPEQHRLVGRFPDTEVLVDGQPAGGKEAVLDAVDPALPADRMVHTITHTALGLTAERRAYAYTNEFHDNYHLITYDYCNTGNIDGDAALELPGQSLEAVWFFRAHRYRGSEQAARVSSHDQIWGRYTVHDVVGDGNASYPVDFTAQYAWYGFDILSTHRLGYSNLGSPLFTDQIEDPSAPDLVAPGDSVGRLTGATMMGRVTLHADAASNDPSYDRSQPRVMAWIDNDEPLTNDGAAHEEYYEDGILSRENPARNPGCTSCFLRAWPHFADRRQPDGRFWDPDGMDLFAGGFSPTTAYGPYDMQPGECVRIAVAEGIAGLSFDAATKIGRLYKRSGPQRDAVAIAFDANGDGVVNSEAFDYTQVFVGTEMQTKNQWVMSARDSLFQTFYRARDVYAASQGMSTYPVVEPPRAPLQLDIRGETDQVALSWIPASGGPSVSAWEVYRTKGWVDNLFASGCLDDDTRMCGYEHVATLPAMRSMFHDTTAAPHTDYFYYVQAVGTPQPADDTAIAGTPGGRPLRSGRYLTQSWIPVSLTGTTAAHRESPAAAVTLAPVAPNPARDQASIRFSLHEASEVTLAVYDALGRRVATIVSGRREAGSHEVTFGAGRYVPGLYVVVLTHRKGILRRSLVLVR